MLSVKTEALLLATFCLGVAGCATYHIQPVSSTELAKWHQGKLNEGYVFYQPELYFLVTPSVNPGKATENDKSAKPADTTAGLTVTPLYLPNPTMAYRVTTFNILAKSDFAFNFKDGWQLSSIADKADNSTIANTIAGELKTLLSASGLPGVALLPPPPTPVQSFLLHPHYTTNGVIDKFEIVELPNQPQTEKK